MAILIKGMEMPKNGDFVEVLIWSDGHVTKTGDSYKDENGRAYYKPCDWEYFSAIELPPHGDLIDRYAAIRSAFKGEQNIYCWDEIEEAIDSVPAIIESEE